ncbi:hypothetical protein ACI2L1_12420 [Streptomyces sp. NPDC019531]|uniref:hypothetical protein n=1 Tax=Streptomyces sp. NPDC019531 TaxID=3365062 RepID=UPI00384D3E28
MNAATMGLVGALAGALVAATAATLGPLALQRRKEHVDERHRRADVVTRRVDIINDVGVHCRAWLIYLVRVLEDEGRSVGPTVGEFDEKSEALRDAAERALAQAAHAGYELSDSGLADALRAMETQVRRSLGHGGPGDLAQLREQASGYFTPREIVRTNMLRQVTREELPTDPLSGTVFDRRNRPRP